MHELKLLLEAEEITAITWRLAKKINADYANKNPVLLAVLKGSFIFVADLIRALDISCEIDFVRARSYLDGTHPSNEIEVSVEGKVDVNGREVILIEDIVDRGKTIETITSAMENLGALRVRSCALLLRDGSPLTPDYTGKVVSEGFIVGYGLDYNEKYRNLPDLYMLKEE